MNYEIVLERRAQKFIQRLAKPEKERLLKTISLLPKGTDIKRLKSNDNYLRLRIGEYRIIYTQDDVKLIICVVDAGNRGQIYNRY